MVYHLNDFKLLCPSYNMVAHGAGLRALPRRKVLARDYGRLLFRDRPAATLMLAAEAYLHKWLRSYESCVTRFLAPSRFVKDKLVENGWDAAKDRCAAAFSEIAAGHDG